MWSSTSVSVRRPIVTTGGCSRKITVSGIAPCETAPASERCSSNASAYGTRPRFMRYARRATRGRLVGLEELARCVEIALRGRESRAGRLPTAFRRARPRRSRCTAASTRSRLSRAAIEPSRPPARLPRPSGERGRRSQALPEHPAVALEVLRGVDPVADARLLRLAEDRRAGAHVPARSERRRRPPRRSARR